MLFETLKQYIKAPVYLCNEIEEKCGSFRKVAPDACKNMEPPFQGIIDCGFCVEKGKGVFTVKVECTLSRCCVKRVKTPLSPALSFMTLLKDLLPALIIALQTKNPEMLNKVFDELKENDVDLLALLDFAARKLPWIFSK